MDDPRPLAEKVLEVLVYAPVGLIAQLGEELPRLAADGRTKVRNRVQVARWVGEMAVHYGRRELKHRLQPSSSVSGEPEQAEPVELPFEGYDNLTAQQIVKLVDSLPMAELGLVREYEVANRARRTVLVRLDRLLSS